MVIKNGTMKRIGQGIIGGSWIAALTTWLTVASPKVQVIITMILGLLSTLGGVLHTQPGNGSFTIGQSGTIGDQDDAIKTPGGAIITAGGGGCTKVAISSDRLNLSLEVK